MSLSLAILAGCIERPGLTTPSEGQKVDIDADGYSPPADCVDTDASVHPGMPEVPYNGVDDDCSAATPDDDLDGDGFPLSTDCDDDRVDVNPAADEVPFDGADNDCDPDTCTPTGFEASPTVLALPPTQASSVPGWLSGFSFSSGSPCSAGTFTSSVIDLDGDGALDLVVTDACDAAGVGTDQWLVYWGGASGFDASPTPWALPSTGATGTDLLDTFEKRTACAVGYFDSELTDLTGDGAYDLVVVDNCDTAGVGTDHWQVYPAEAGGFSEVGVDWDTPVAGGRAFDLTGDGFPDLVDFPSGNDAHEEPWVVYPGDGEGFSTTPLTWSIPDLGVFDLSGSFSWEGLVETGFYRGYHGQGCSGYISVALADFTLDGRVDEVFLDYCDVGGVGTTQWNVHAGGIAGFELPTPWELPSERLATAADPVDWMSSAFEPAVDLGCGAANAIGTLDWTDDGWPDLLVLDACNPGEWSLFVGGVGGFALERTPFYVPSVVQTEVSCAADISTAYSLDVEREMVSCSGNGVAFWLVDRDGDGRAELILTDSADLAVGTSEWLVYAGRCEG